MKVRYLRSALADLAEVRTFIAKDDPGAAVMVSQILRTAIAALAEFPEQGRLGRVYGTRELVIPRLPFVVAYEIMPDYVRILAVLHAARLWPSSF